MRRPLGALLMALLLMPGALRAQTTTIDGVRTLGSSGTTLNATDSGACTVSGACISIEMGGYTAIAAQFTGTCGTCTAAFESSVDGTTFVAQSLVPSNGTTPVTSTAAAGVWTGSVGPAQIFRVRLSARASGSFVVTLRASLALAKLTITDTGAATPAGDDTQVQFNAAGSFGADSGFTYDTTAHALTVTQIISGEFGLATGFLAPGVFGNPTPLSDEHAGGATVGFSDLVPDGTTGESSGFSLNTRVTPAVGGQTGEGLSTDFETAGAQTLSYVFPNYFRGVVNNSIDTYGVAQTLDFDLVGGVTVAEWDSMDRSVTLSDATVLTTYYGDFSAIHLLNTAAVGTGYMRYMAAPTLAAGAAWTGDLYGDYIEDYSSVTVGGTAYAYFYAGGFSVDATGHVKAAGYRSSDGSDGATGTCAGFPVVKNGLVVSCTGI